MLPSLLILLGCQLLGEAAALGLGLPVPGPVIGMALLFLCLLGRGRAPDGLEPTAMGLLSHLGLLFVPAGVGVIAHLPLIEAEWRPIGAAVIGSTLLAVLVTGVVFRLLAGRPVAPGDGR